MKQGYIDLLKNTLLHAYWEEVEGIPLNAWLPCYNENMQKAQKKDSKPKSRSDSFVLKVNRRGTLTLPKELRSATGLEGECYVLVKATREGILVQPSATLPIEIYTEERIAEFNRHNEEELAEFKLK